MAVHGEMRILCQPLEALMFSASPTTCPVGVASLRVMLPFVSWPLVSTTQGSTDRCSPRWNWRAIRFWWTAVSSPAPLRPFWAAFGPPSSVLLVSLLCCVLLFFAFLFLLGGGVP